MVPKPFPHIINKINATCSIYLNVRTKVIQVLEENMRVNLYDLWLNKAFLHLRVKAKVKKKNR